MRSRLVDTLRSVAPIFVACACSLLFSGCRDSGDEEIIGRLGEDGHIESALMEQFSPEKYKSLPPLRVRKRGDDFHVWLELEGWQEGEKPWLSADMTDTRGDVAHVIADLKVTESQVQFGKEYRVRALKVIWPDEHAEDMRQGHFGPLRVERMDTVWRPGPQPDEATLHVVLGLRNVGTDSMRLSGELYLTGDDTVLIAKLAPSAPSASGRRREAPESGFVSAESFFISEVSGNSTGAFELITNPVKTGVLRKFRALRVEHLAYGWRRDIAHPPKQ